MGPTLQHMKTSKAVWPHLMWVHPTSPGLLKPSKYQKTQGDASITKFVKNLEMYLQDYGVPAFDFRQMTKFINSHDGTHYGSGVNILKCQILLNYLANRLHDAL